MEIAGPFLFATRLQRRRALSRSSGSRVLSLLLPFLNPPPELPNNIRNPYQKRDDDNFWEADFWELHTQNIRDQARRVQNKMKRGPHVRKRPESTSCHRPARIDAAGCYDLAAMSHDTDAEELRFQTFVATTDQAARDRAAFVEFLEAVHNATQCAVMSNMYDGDDHAGREFEEMKRAITDLLFGLLPRVDLSDVLANAEGVGYAIRYGVVEPRRGALDHIKAPADLDVLAERGYEADEAQTQLRMAEIASREA